MGLPKALRNVKNPEEVKKLLDSGAIKIGKAPKTKKTKESFADIKKRMEAKNKESAFNFAFKKYKDIDKKPMEMDEVISIYTNLNKYPKGRSIIFGDIAEIQRRHMLPNIGKRSREDLVNKLNKMVVTKKQPNPFKKAPDEVTDQIEMDFIDWDPKGMAGGGLAYMLGEGGSPKDATNFLNRIAPKGERLAYINSKEEQMLKDAGGSGIMTQQGIPSFTEDDEDTGGMGHHGGGHGIGSDTVSGPSPDSNENWNQPTRKPAGPTRSGGDDNQSWYNKPYVKAASFMVNPIGTTIVGGGKSLYDQHMKDKAIGTNITDAALSNSQYFGDTTKKMQRDYRKTTGLRTPDEPPRDEDNDNVLPWWLKKPQQSSLGLEAIKPKDDFDLNAVVEGRTPSRFYADGGRIGFANGNGAAGSSGAYAAWKKGIKNGVLSPDTSFWDFLALDNTPGLDLPEKAEGGRIGFDKGGFNKGRRNFMKLMAGLASIPVVGKLFKPLKALKAAKTIKLAPATGMPEWFPSLVNKVIKEGDDVTKKLATIERETVHTKKLGEFENVTVYNNIDNGYIRVEYGGPEFDKTGKVIRASNDPEVVHLEYISPKVIEGGKYKGKKTKAEFGAAESEPEVVNWDGDIEWSGIREVNRVEDLTSDVSKLKQYATGKNPTIKEILDTSKKKTYRQNLETDTMEQIDYIENRHGGRSIDDYIEESAERGDLHRGADVEGIGYNLPEKIKKAKGGLAHMLGE
jgi:hypothetical protein